MSSTDDENKAPEEHPATQAKEGIRGWLLQPPAEHRFGPGNNANPKGRKKGSRSRKLMIQEVLFEQIAVREGDEIKQMSKLEAVLKKTLSQALGGDKKAALTIIGLAQKEGLLTPEEEEAVENFSENDAAIMEDVKRRLAVARSEHPSEAPAQSRSASASEPPQAHASQSATGLPKLTRPVLPVLTRPVTVDPPVQPVSDLPKLTRPVP